MLKQVRLWLIGRKLPVFKALLSFMGDYCHRWGYGEDPAWLTAMRPLFLESYRWAQQRSMGFVDAVPPQTLAELLLNPPSELEPETVMDLRRGLLETCLIHPGMVEHYAVLHRTLDGAELVRLARSQGMPLTRKDLLGFCDYLAQQPGELASYGAPLLRESINQHKDIEVWTWRKLHSYAVIPELSWLVRIPQEEWPLLACNLPNPAARAFLRYMLEGRVARD